MPTDKAGNFHMNAQVARSKDAGAPAPPMADPNADPMADPDVQAAIQLLQQKGITADQVMMAMEPDADQLGGPSDNDQDNAPAGGESEY